MDLRDFFESLLGVVLLCGVLALIATDEARGQDVIYCYDRSSYPTKVVVIAAGDQCPPGYCR